MSRMQGKVAAFVSEHEVAITLGRRDGVRPGMKFAILSADEVKDPDTGEVIGMLEREKARVQVVDVQDRMAVCSTYAEVPRSRVGATSFEDALEALLEPRAASSARSTVARFRARYPSLKPSGDYVRVGDRVQQIDEG